MEPREIDVFIRCRVPGDHWAAALPLGADLLGNEPMFTLVADCGRTKPATPESTGRPTQIMKGCLFGTGEAGGTLELDTSIDVDVDDAVREFFLRDSDRATSGDECRSGAST
ncbi:hypothetical protein [Kitasatospora sp. NPDC051914]|uniref:hypothetical protein n=1 Tax=Kitasatospora sp. NPDC051914 TaxID=3154945 RepID=UPI0034288766